VDERGTFDCPICGHGKPHSHTEDEIKFRRDQLPFRLANLWDELKKSGVSFYSAMHRVYGTDYGSSAEAALAREIETWLTALRSRSMKED
jgi:hypothetical protein